VSSSCGTCGSTWSAPARWCGRCGAALAPTDEREPGPGTWRGSATWLLTAAVIAGVVGAMTAGPDVAPAATVAHAEVEVATAATAADDDEPTAPTARSGPECDTGRLPATCLRWFEEHGPTPAEIVAGEGVVATLSRTGTLRLLRRGDGATRWTRSVDAHGAQGRLLAPAVGTLPVRLGRRLLLFELSAGRQLADIDVGSDATVLASGPRLLAAGASALTAWSVTGERSWERPIGPGERALATATGIFVHDRSGALTRLHSNTGTDRWTRSVPPGELELDRAATGDVLVVALDPDDASPELRGLDLEGETRWRRSLPGPVTELTLPPDGETAAAVVTTDDGDALVLFDPRDGASTAPVPLGTEVVTAPRIRDARVAVISEDPAPRLTVVDRRDGEVRLEQALPLPPDDLALTGEATVVTATARGIEARSSTTGAVRWEVRLAGARLATTEPLVVFGSRAALGLEPTP
jgi:outer membrane protein assembly factor BamB